MLENNPGEEAKNRRISKEKRRLLFVIGPATFTLSLILGFVLDHLSGGSKIGDLISTLVLNLIAFAWIRYDADERRYGLHPLFPYAVVIFGTLALIYYLFRSRGFVAGMASIGWFVVYAIALMIVATIVAVLSAMVLVTLGIIPSDAL